MWGDNCLRGIQLAADEINGQGGALGRQVKLVAQNTQEIRGGANSVSAYRRLSLNNEINFMVGTTKKDLKPRAMPQPMVVKTTRIA